jgi:DNA-directed RNA polymerase subunit RPC12/RpoP
MIAYKGFELGLVCRGYQFNTGLNVTEKANCHANGFHCAENPMDCLSYYGNMDTSEYWIVNAGGDIDEDGDDSKIACTELTLIKKLTREEFFLHGLANMADHPLQKWSHVKKDKAKAACGYAAVRGTDPAACGELGDILAFAKENKSGGKITQVALARVDGEHILPGVWYGVDLTERKTGRRTKMNVNALEKRCRLRATPEMMRLAAADVPEIRKVYSWEEHKYVNGLYMRCHIQDGILVAAFFLADHLRSGGHSPVYELFADRENRRFITYDNRQNKWRTAKLDRLSWPEYLCRSGKWIAQRDGALIQKYLGGKDGGYDGLFAFQQDIREEALIKRHKKETDAWDLDLTQIPKLPKDWQRWTAKAGIPQNYIYYHYSRKGAKTGYCTYCERDVPINQPRHNKEGYCPRCRRRIVFKSAGRAGTVVTDTAIMYLIQRCRDGFVIREFTGYRKYPKGGYRLFDQYAGEIRRAIFSPDGEPLRAYYMGLYKQRYSRWIQCGVCEERWQGEDSGIVYGKTLPSLAKRELSRTGLMEAMEDFGRIDPEKYLAVLNHAPYLEKLAKARLPQMVRECLSHSWIFKDALSDADAASLTKLLGISTQALKRLRQCRGGTSFLEWLRYEQESGKVLSDDMIGWYCREKITPDDIAFIRDRMSAPQIYNYILRQMHAGGKESHEVLNTWADYLSMAARLKMDAEDAIVFRVNKLFKRHDEMVEYCNRHSAELELERIRERYPHVDEICASLKAKYEYTDGDYAVAAPAGIGDILAEGRELHHCVDKSDRYWERIERREAYVLFLRKAAEPYKAYYTLEVEPNGTIRQKRTMYNRQNEDIEDAMNFLAEWQKVVSRRLDAGDLELAKASRVLRDQQYAELRDNKAIIHTGELAGTLLVDVLLADLMENTELPKAA